jgi:hypothetical protein
MKTLNTIGLCEKTDLVETILERSHLETVALGFLALAVKSDFFKKWIKQRLLVRETTLTDASGIPEINFEYEHISWLPPINLVVAESKLSWLFSEIDYAPEYQKQRIIGILNLACGTPVPQAAAWGIVFNETLGPTLGNPELFNRCIDYSQVVILGPGWNLFKPQDLTRQVSRVSLQALAKCIEDANFKLDRLEPEVSSWLLEGSGVRLYSAESDQDLKNVLTSMRKSGLPLASISEEVNMLALQPCITGSYDTLLAELTPLE